MRAPSTSAHCRWPFQSISRQSGSAVRPYSGSACSAAWGRAGRADDGRNVFFAMPRTVPGVARIALDIDSTLHDYWPLFRRVVSERHGLDLPYEEQREWGTTRLPRDDVVACIEETHSNENILA